MEDLASNITNTVGTVTLIAVGGSILITVLILFFVFRALRGVGGMGKQTAQLLVTGQPAQAKILSLNASGMMVNYNPVVDLVLEVYPQSDMPYQVQLRTMVPSIKVPQVQPGMTVEVRFNPANKQEVALALK